MKQPVTLSRTLMDPSEKESSVRKSSSREFSNDLNSEEANNLNMGHSDEPTNFDFSNFGMFFKNKGGNMKAVNEGTSGFTNPRKRSDETSFNKEAVLKTIPSKEFSNLDELFEDTTVITTPQEVTRSQSKQLASEISHFKPLSHEETKEAHHENPFFNLSEKGGSKKESFNSVFPGLLKTLKEDKPENDLLGIVPKSNLGNGDEADKIEASLFKDSKFFASNMNVEVLERIKTKALHHRHSSLANSANNSNSSSSGNGETRTNNNSVFTGARKINKSSTPVNTFIKKETEELNFYLDPVKDSNNAMFLKYEYETQADVLKLEDLIQSSPQEKDSNVQLQNLFSGPLEVKDFSKSLDNNENKKSILSTLHTDSTVDSENFNTLTFNQQQHHQSHHHHSNSFSTFFNTKSNSYNNSAKMEFHSPLRVDSARLYENPTGSYSSSNKNDIQQGSDANVQRNLFNFDPNLISYYGGGFGSNNNTDSSNSLSWNDDYLNTNFGSNMSTPQERHKSNYQSLNISPSAVMEHQYMSSVQISPHTLKNRVNRSYTAHASNKSSAQGVPNFNANQFKDATAPSLNKETKDNKGKKKNNEAKDSASFEIDLTKLDANGKTTLMIRNIPNKYDLPLMLQTIEKNHKAKFDFFYLPIDPRNKCNVGYAFINFNEPKFIKEFFLEFNNKKWDKFNSEKICDIKYGRIQGKKALMHHFQYSNVMNQQDKKLKPYFLQEYEGMNNQRIKDLINKQRLESVEDNYDYKQE